MSTDQIKRITASEIVASSKIEADADLIAQLDKQLAKEVPTQLEEKKTVKIVLVGDGNYIIISGVFTVLIGGIQVEVAVELGRATSLQHGSGVVRTTYVAHGLSGGYRLEFVAGVIARVYEGIEQVWFWVGDLKGLEGSIDVVFDFKALSNFANATFPVTT